MHIDSTTIILFAIALIGFILVRLMNNKNYGNKVAEILLILFSFAVGSILLPLILGFIQLFGDLAYYLNTNIRDNYPLVFWGLSIIIGVIVTYWSHKKQAK